MKNIKAIDYWPVEIEGGCFFETIPEKAKLWSVFTRGADGLSNHVKDFKTRKAVKLHAEKLALKHGAEIESHYHEAKYG